MRVIAGLFAAVLASALALVPASIVIGIVQFFQGRGFRVFGMEIMVLIVPVIVFAMTLLIGIPVAFWLKRRGRTRARDLAIWGAALGAAPFLVFDVVVVVLELRSALQSEFFGVGQRLQYLARDIPRAVAAAGLGSWCGLWAALAYWQVAIVPKADPKADHKPDPKPASP